LDNDGRTLQQGFPAIMRVRIRGQENPSLSAQPRVLLTSPMHPALQPVLAAQCDWCWPRYQRATLKRLIADAEGLVVRAQLPPDLFDHAPKLRAVVRHGVGLDMIPVEAATARGIPWPTCRAPTRRPWWSTAWRRCCICGATSPASMRACAARAGPSRGRWRRRHRAGGQHLGIVGVGAIGGRLATIASALGMRVLGLTRRPGNLPAGVEAVDQRELFARSDVVVLSCPLTEQTRGLVDADTVAS
jgi:D-3-phosphoglycerate dehydrogenase